VRVCPYTATGTPCSPLSNLFLDPGLTVATSNPATTDAYGNASLWVTPGPVIVQVIPVNGIVYSYLQMATAGTVTSVGLTMPNIFNVSASPVTGSGSITVTLANQSSDLVFGNCTGSTAPPSFCALTSAMIPSTLGPTAFTGNVGITGTLGVTGASTLSGSTSVGGVFQVAGATTLSSTLGVISNTTIGGTLGVTGATTLSGNGANGNAAIKSASSDAVQWVSQNGIDTNDGLSPGTAKLTIPAAIAALPISGALKGGVVYVLGNQTQILTTTLNIGGGGATVFLKPLGRVYLLCNITNDTACIDILPDSGMDGAMSGGNNFMVDTYNSSTVVSTLVESDPNSVDEQIRLSGVQVSHFNGGTVSNALVDLSSAYDSSVYDMGVFLGAANEIGLYLHNASTSFCPNNLNFYDIWINATYTSGQRPLVIKDDLGCAPGPISFFGGDIGHPGIGNHNIEINGNGNNYALNVSFFNIYQEAYNGIGTASSVDYIQDAQNVVFAGGQIIKGGTGATLPCFEIKTVAAGSGPVQIQNFCTGGSNNTYVLNDDTGVTDMDNAGGLYRYPGNSPSAKVSMVGTVQTSVVLANQGTACTNAELALSAAWGTTAAVSAVAGQGQTCQWTITSNGTGQTTAPTITDTLTNVLPTATVVCEMRTVGGSGSVTPLFNQTTLSATAPVFTGAAEGGATFTPVSGSTYIVVRRCGP
jgi:hypothetical protein